MKLMTLAIDCGILSHTAITLAHWTAADSSFI
jgi:hypothetical protein